MKNLPVVKTDIQIRFSDMDPLGHVSNNAYSEYIEVARVEWLGAIEGERPSVVVANLSIDFIRELGLKDKIYVMTSCIKKGTKSLTLSQDVFSEETCVAKSTVVVVGFDMNTRQSTDLLPEWEVSTP